ncbi:hypothetical protein WDU94_006649 [Cyamophila willieti]
MRVNFRAKIIPKRADLTCTNCNTKVTTIWRRYPSGEMVCNACGLYYRLHCRPRPVSMRRDNIHPRKRRPKKFFERKTPSAATNSEQIDVLCLETSSLVKTGPDPPPSVRCILTPPWSGETPPKQFIQERIQGVGR